MEENNNKPPTPSWLKRVQDNSWEPEILISGLTIAFIFIMNNYIHNFFAFLVQDFDATISANLFFMLFTVSINIVKVVLILHLVLRGLWTGLIGLSYVYPDGVKNEKLPAIMRNVIFEKPAELILKTENICSLLFSYIFFFVLLLLFMTIAYMPLILIEAIFAENKLVYFLIYIIFLIAFLMSILLIKKFRLKYSNHIANNIAYTFSTNVGNGASMLLLIASLVVSMIISMPQVRNFDYINFLAEKNHNQKSYFKDNENYLDERNNELRIQKAVITSYEVEHGINLFVSNYKADDITLQKAKLFPKKFLEVSNKTSSGKIGVNSLYNIYIDSVQVSDLTWVTTQNSFTSQKGFQTHILENLKPGVHKLVIDKIVWNWNTKTFKYVSPWDGIVFYKK